MLSRPQFVVAASAFARCHPQWQYIDGHRPGYNYLTRTTTHFFKSPASPGYDDLEAEDVEAEDAATATAQLPPTMLTVQEHIVYSASFNVPAFYFTAHDTSVLYLLNFVLNRSFLADGTPCALAALVNSSFFKVKPPAEAEASDYALTLPHVSFPLLSQGDHPTLGTPCWYFHPCETDVAVNEFMCEVEEADWSEEQRLVRWMELWIMIVGSMLNV